MDVLALLGVACASNADSYQQRLHGFMADSAVVAALYDSGATVSFDPSSDGGGLGDVLQIVTRHTHLALNKGCRSYSPHVAHGERWRYAVLASDAGHCSVTDGWRCVFRDVLAPLPAPDAGWTTSQKDERHGFATLTEARCAGAHSLRTHKLDLEPTLPLCNASWLLMGCVDSPKGCAEVERLLSSPKWHCDREAWVDSQILRLLWAPALPLVRYVDGVRAATVGASSAPGAPKLPPRYVGLHMRRGDACRCFRGCCWSNNDGNGRECLPVDDYVALAHMLAKALNVDHVFIATEDAANLARAQLLLRRRGLVPMAQSWGRAAFSEGTLLSDCQSPVRGGLLRIEEAMDRKRIDADGVVLSAVADIQLLAEADGLVGGISSFTTLAHKLGSAMRDTPMPLIDVGSAAVQAWVRGQWEGQRNASTRAEAEEEEEEEESGWERCPSCAQLVSRLDLDHDGLVSRCEIGVIYKPLGRVMEFR